jgi:5-methylcytosine-specific restriction protein B
VEVPVIDQPTAAPAEESAGSRSLTALADELLIDEEELVEIALLLETKNQLVFYGPPGTGKTFVAKRLAETLAGDPSRVRLVQFHPSYAYEDFVEGYRPRLVDGQATFELVPGPLRRLAALAAADPAHLHILVIDEMNRGNVAKVLGELYFLLEYRDELIDLQYSPERFAMPGNLRIIGTMNTADRSIALLDAALRRRFAFIPFFPDRPPIAGLLRRWLKRHHPEMIWVADIVDAANQRLADRNGAIGPSFFIVSGLDETRLGLIWKHEIMPYLEDHFFDDPDRLVDFRLDRLRAALSSTATPEQPLTGGADVDAALSN